MFCRFAFTTHYPRRAHIRSLIGVECLTGLTLEYAEFNVYNMNGIQSLYSKFVALYPQASVLCVYLLLSMNYAVHVNCETIKP